MVSPQQKTGSIDPPTVLLAILLVAALTSLFLLLRWTVALAAVAGILLITVVGVALLPRRPQAVGRLLCGIALGLTVGVIVAQEAALTVVAAGKWRYIPADGQGPKVWGSRLIPALRTALRDRDAATRFWAAEALAKFGPSTAPALRSAARDPDPLVRWRVVTELSHWPTPENQKVLLAAIRDPDRQVRQTAQKSLAEIGGAANLRALARQAGERNPDGGPGFVLHPAFARDYAAAVACLSDSDPRVRAGAAEAVRQIGTARALELLQSLQSDADVSVRLIALRALEASSGKASWATKDPRFVTPDLAPEWRGGAAPPAVDPDAQLRQYLSLISRGAVQQQDAARWGLDDLLGRFPPGSGSRVSEATYAAIVSDLSDRVIREGPRWASLVLQRHFAKPQFLPVFVRLSEQPSVEVRHFSAGALADIGGPEAVAAIQRVDASWQTDQRTYCRWCRAHFCYYCCLLRELDPSLPLRHNPLVVHHHDAIGTRHEGPAQPGHR